MTKERISLLAEGVMVNFSMGALIFGPTFWLFLWGCFWMKLIFKPAE